MRIWSAPYTLVARASLSGKALNKIRIGSLLKVEEGGAVGYADLHPWPEYGDVTLEDQLKFLADGHPTEIARRSLALAALDREARSLGVSAFEGMSIPDSHFLVSEISSLKEVQLEGVWSEGFRVLKFKLGRNVEAETQRLLELEPALRRFSIRLDFSGLMMAPEFGTFVEAIPETLLKRIEFIEDPMPWNESLWGALLEIKRVPFALDRLSEAELYGLQNHGVGPVFKWVVLKPATQSPAHLLSLARMTNSRMCVTSYLDHPVGQMGAALEAAKLLASTGENPSFSNLLGTCGLVTHRLFEKTEFSEAIKSKGPDLSATEGIGIGFDTILAKQNWQEVK